MKFGSDSSCQFFFHLIQVYFGEFDNITLSPTWLQSACVQNSYVIHVGHSDSDNLQSLMNEIFCDVGSECAKRFISFCHKDEINVKQKQLGCELLLLQIRVVLVVGFIFFGVLCAWPWHSQSDIVEHCIARSFGCFGVVRIHKKLHSIYHCVLIPIYMLWFDVCFFFSILFI